MTHSQETYAGMLSKAARLPEVSPSQWQSTCKSNHTARHKASKVQNQAHSVSTNSPENSFCNTSVNSCKSDAPSDLTASLKPHLLKVPPLPSTATTETKPPAREHIMKPLHHEFQNKSLFMPFQSISLHYINMQHIKVCEASISKLLRVSIWFTGKYNTLCLRKVDLKLFCSILLTYHFPFLLSFF